MVSLLMILPFMYLYAFAHTHSLTYIMDILSFYFSHGKVSTTVTNATFIIASLPAIFNQLEGD